MAKPTCPKTKEANTRVSASFILLIINLKKFIYRSQVVFYPSLVDLVIRFFRYVCMKEVHLNCASFREELNCNNRLFLLLTKIPFLDYPLSRFYLKYLACNISFPHFELVAGNLWHHCWITRPEPDS